MKRIAIFLTLVVVLGMAGAGFYYYKAASNGDEAAATVAENAENEGTSEDQEQPPEEGEDQADEAGAGDEDEEGEAPAPVRVVEVAVGSVSTYITATANLVPEDEVKVLAEAEGRVTRLLVEEGDHVRRGQLLAALLRDEAQIAFNKAEVKAANAQMAYDRAVRMAGEELISQEEFDTTAMNHRIGQQELAEARWKLEKTEIRAPFAGRVTQRAITLGQHMRPGDELFVVTDFDPLIARIYLPEKDVMSLSEGTSVDITLKADERIEFGGRIRQISPVVDTATGTVKVTVAAIDPPSAVRPGGFVTIDIVRETHPDTLVLPREAVIRELQKAHVFVARDEVAEKRAVTLGLEENASLEIVSGLEAGEQVVVAGQGGLKDGAPIKILPQEDDAQATALRNGNKRRVG